MVSVSESSFHAHPDEIKTERKIRQKKNIIARVANTYDNIGAILREERDRSVEERKRKRERERDKSVLCGLWDATRDVFLSHFLYRALVLDVKTSFSRRKPSGERENARDNKRHRRRRRRQGDGEYSNGERCESYDDSHLALYKMGLSFIYFELILTRRSRASRNGFLFKSEI